MLEVGTIVWPTEWHILQPKVSSQVSNTGDVGQAWAACFAQSQKCEYGCSKALSRITVTLPAVKVSCSRIFSQYARLPFQQDVLVSEGASPSS